MMSPSTASGVNLSAARPVCARRLKGETGSRRVRPFDMNGKILLRGSQTRGHDPTRGLLDLTNGVTKETSFASFICSANEY